MCTTQRTVRSNGLAWKYSRLSQAPLQPSRVDKGNTASTDGSTFTDWCLGVYYTWCVQCVGYVRVCVRVCTLHYRSPQQFKGLFVTEVITVTTNIVTYLRFVVY